MADDLVDRDAAAMRETAIAQRGRPAACLLRHLVDNCVEVVGAGTGTDMRGQTVAHIVGRTAPLPHTPIGSVVGRKSGVTEGCYRGLAYLEHKNNHIITSKCTN